MKTLIIIPAYNEEGNIIKVLEGLQRYKKYDVIVVDDCSKDNTFMMVKKYIYNHRDHNVKLISLPFNLGIGGAVQTGYKYANLNGYDIAIQFDGDGQHKADYLDELVDCLCNYKADMVIGSRFINGEGFQSSFLRRCGIKFFSNMLNCLYGYRVIDTTSGYRAVNKNIINLYADSYPVDYPEPETNGKLMRMGYNIIEIPVVMESRERGKSSISAVKSVWYMLKVTLSILIDRFRR